MKRSPDNQHRRLPAFCRPRHSLLRLPVLLAVACLALPATAEVDGLAQLRELAQRLEHAEGVPRDLPRARRLYCLAALQGDARSMYQLGWLYLHGHGVARHDGIAKDWLIRAQQQGDGFAGRLLAVLPNTRRQPDPDCTPLDASSPSRQQIEGWVRLLAPEYGLDAELVLAVIAAESNFNPRALSPKNAHGLMQLLPTTAQRFAVKDIWHPIQNLCGGMAYLGWLMAKFDADLSLSLAAYNAGEQAVQDFGGVPPYQETKAYVRRILADYRGPR